MNIFAPPPAVCACGLTLFPISSELLCVTLSLTLWKNVFKGKKGRLTLTFLLSPTLLSLSLSLALIDKEKETFPSNDRANRHHHH